MAQQDDDIFLPHGRQEDLLRLTVAPEWVTGSTPLNRSVATLEMSLTNLAVTALNVPLAVFYIPVGVKQDDLSTSDAMLPFAQATGWVAQTCKIQPVGYFAFDLIATDPDNAALAPADSLNFTLQGVAVGDAPGVATIRFEAYTSEGETDGACLVEIALPVRAICGGNYSGT
ncbi:hypothetical protein [Paraherbaspirillum soli]|uniref:Uncharacterized protein n=1 Tax=Paraherbaspirillum soli TaxID=631222 RepID=A0ABW0M8G2_9BURK